PDIVRRHRPADQVLDHLRRDLLPAEVQDVVGPANDLQAARLVENPDVARVEPAILEYLPRRLRIVEVLVEHVVGPYPNLPGLAERQRLVILVDHLDARAGPDGADLAGTPDRADEAGFVRAVHVAEVRREPRQRSLAERVRDARAEGEDRQRGPFRETARQLVDHPL